MLDFKRCGMNIESFKQLFTANFNAMNVNTLEHYLREGEKLLCNMIELDPVVVEIVSKISTELNSRG